MAMLTDLIDQVLDEKYRIDLQLGQGGMGAVYLATHLGTGRPVAVKVIAPQFMANEEFVERFKREAKAAGLLRHPNVINVTDFGFINLNSDRLAYLQKRTEIKRKQNFSFTSLNSDRLAYLVM